MSSDDFYCEWPTWGIDDEEDLIMELYPDGFGDIDGVIEEPEEFISEEEMQL